ncbi:MAG: choice-of-anchor A family protein [Lachnospiraceae bacterium]|nr:choice-of-anchor A family protein [Lachnospiraceae bacterium]
MHLLRKGRVVSFVLTLVLAFGLLDAPAKASSGAKFAGGNNASNILSKYSVFVENNFSANNHIMGAIAVGGTYTNSNFFGDAAIYPSYIKTWNSGRVGNGALNDNLSKRVNRTVYYGTRSGDLGGNPAVQNSGFLSMSSVFSSLRAQSKALAERGETISGNVIDLTNRNEDVYITVPYSKLNSLQINVPSYDWFRKHILCVSVTGAGSGAQFNGWSIKINGGDIGNNFRFKFPGADSQYNIQLNLSGMNLFWNFPDATSLNVMGQAGHLIAPSANVTNTSGNYEGGVIAKSFTSTSEAHFYPCNHTLATSSGKQASPTPTATKVPTKTASPTPTVTKEPTKQASPTPTATPVPKKVSPTPTVTPIPKKVPPTPTVTPVSKKATPTPTPVVKKNVATSTPTPTPVVKKNVATSTPTPTPVVKKNVATATPTPTPVPQKNVATATPTPVPKKNTPTATPTPVPYRRPSPTPKPVTPENPDEPKTGHGIFSKVTEKNQELEGARLTLTAYTDGIDLSDIKRASTSGGTDYVASKNTITWTSTASRTILEDLPNGTYRLHEDCAPANYNVAFDIYFRMKGGVICDMDGNPVPDGVLVMIDTSLTDPGHQVAKSSDIPVKEGTGKGVVRSPQTGEQTNAGNLVWLLLLVMVAAACPAVFKKRRFLKR